MSFSKPSIGSFTLPSGVASRLKALAQEKRNQPGTNWVEVAKEQTVTAVGAYGALLNQRFGAKSSNQDINGAAVLVQRFLAEPSTAAQGWSVIADIIFSVEFIIHRLMGPAAYEKFSAGNLASVLQTPMIPLPSEGSSSPLDTFRFSLYIMYFANYRDAAGKGQTADMASLTQAEAEVFLAARNVPLAQQTVRRSGASFEIVNKPYKTIAAYFCVHADDFGTDSTIQYVANQFFSYEGLSIPDPMRCLRIFNHENALARHLGISEEKMAAYKAVTMWMLHKNKIADLPVGEIKSAMTELEKAREEKTGQALAEALIAIGRKITSPSTRTARNV